MRHKKNIKKNSSKKNYFFSEQSPEVELSNLLFSLMVQRKPDYKKPDIQNWAKEIDLMIRIDNRTPEVIREVILWSQSDAFWQNNILSTSKLREKFDQLEMKMNQGRSKPGNTPGRYIEENRPFDPYANVQDPTPEEALELLK